MQSPSSGRPWRLVAMKPSGSIRSLWKVSRWLAQIAEVAKGGGYDLILTGKETIDYNGGAVGGMLAELLDLPYSALATNFS
jgi:electron transfer flavoprotein alpha/beta subunit